MIGGFAMLGLKRGTVMLCGHETAWEIEARETIARLKNILGAAAKDIQHVGSTSIESIKAKPIIDIAVAVDDFADVLAHESELKSAGFYYCPKNDMDGRQKLFACGSFYESAGDLQTHFIHVVKADSREWKDYINFRDYLRANPKAAKEYEALKISLEKECAVDEGRERYLAGKQPLIQRLLREAAEWRASK